MSQPLRPSSANRAGTKTRVRRDGDTLRRHARFPSNNPPTLELGRLLAAAAVLSCAHCAFRGRFCQPCWCGARESGDAPSSDHGGPSCCRPSGRCAWVGLGACTHVNPVAATARRRRARCGNPVRRWAKRTGELALAWLVFSDDGDGQCRHLRGGCCRHLLLFFSSCTYRPCLLCLHHCYMHACT